MKKKLFLLDAYALIFRAYYALIKMPRITHDGFNTSAIFGFVNTLEEVLRRENPTHIAVCFDPAGPTFRSKAYADYKGEREATPEDIKLSIPIIKDIIRAYNIPILEVPDFEADDVIGTMAKLAEKEDFTTYMMTPDKDFGQLVSPNILQFKPAYRGQDFELRGEEEVCARYVLQRPAQVIDLLALMGDKVDNIPGCPGVGEKTAVKLIQEYDSVENLISHTDELKGALKTKISENVEQIEFSKFLATIRTDVPVEADPDSLVRRTPDAAKLKELFDKLEFRTLGERVLRRLREERVEAVAEKEEQLMADLQPAAVEVNNLEVEIVDNDEKLAAMQKDLAEVSQVGVYAVYAGDNDVTCRWIGTAIDIPGKKSRYVKMTEGSAQASLFEELDPDYEARGAVLDLLARKDITKVTDASKMLYVLASLRRTDSAPALENFYDITLAHYLLQPEMRHGVDMLSQSYLGVTLPAMPPLEAKKSGKNIIAAASAEEIAPVAAKYARAVSMLQAPLAELLSKENLVKVYEEIEAPLVEVLADMELTGVRIDVPALEEAARVMEGKLEELEKDIHQLAGEVFNVGSPAKVGEILFEKLGLDDKAKKTKTGQYSTSEEVLEKVAHKNPIVGKILEYRQLKKLLSTYLTALPAAINPATGKVHTNYNQTVTATGRISSSNPNLQNIPVREDVGREIRRAFIPSAGNLFLSADYSQIELRLVADFADDATMVDAFAKGEDIHAITAAKIYHKSNPEEVTADERRHAKTANFGILYGISAFGLASRLGISRADAKSLIDNYFENFHTIRKYMANSVEFAREHGYVLTKFGRLRRLPDINSKNPVVRGYAERNAVNAPVQGTAADIIKIAMIRIYRRIKEAGLRSKMIMQVHDELNFDVVPAELPALQEIVVREMEDVWKGKVLLTASSGVAENWLDAH